MLFTLGQVSICLERFGEIRQVTAWLCQFSSP